MNNLGLSISFKLKPIVSFNATNSAVLNPNPTVFVGGLGKKSAMCPPINNMGETKSDWATTIRRNADELDAIATKSEMLVRTADGKVKALPIRVPASGHVAVLDWLNITVGMETFIEDYAQRLNNAKQQGDDVEFIHNAVFEVAAYVEMLFGKSCVLGKPNKTGRNFYKYSYPFGNEQNPYGLICIGGQRNTVLIMLNGTGCALAKDGWERRVNAFLSDSDTKRPKITRVDLAHDDFDGSHSSAEWADEMDKIGGFRCGNRTPNVQHLGNWRRPNGKGRTLAIGQRESGKYYRGYERGRKEGDKDSLWFRSEVEFKSSDRVLPFEILLDPSSYFIGSYPCFRDFDLYHSPERVETTEKTASVTMQSSIKTIQRQFGKYINVYRQFMTDADILDLIQCADPKAVPKRLAMAVDFADRQAQLQAARDIVYGSDFEHYTPQPTVAEPFHPPSTVVDAIFETRS